MKNFGRDFLESHKDYYSGVDGPIGGDERFRWVASSFFKDARGQKILEVGCGEGSLLQMIRAGNEVHGVDISQSGVDKTRAKSIPCHCLDASNEPLPYADGFFDTAITLETIEHVENPHRMLWELKRILKQGGTLVISIPGERVYHPFVYPGLFSRKNFSEFLRANGFVIEQVAGWGQAPLLDHWVRGVREGKNGALKGLAELVYWIGRKRNLLMRKRLGTPLRWAFCLNFICRNEKKSLSRVEEVARQTTPR